MWTLTATDGPIVADGKYRLKHATDPEGARRVWLESLESYPFAVAPDRYISGPKAGEAVPGNWGAGFASPLGWIVMSCCLKSEAEAERSAESWRASEGSGRVRGEVRRWRESDGRIRLVAEGQRGEIPLSDGDRAVLWDYLESLPPVSPGPEPSARQLDPELQRVIDQAETESLLELERTPLARPIPERNPGGRCPECGYTHGHRMDCCLV